jgi:co-chaperonin GroES (HSP10)
MIQPRNDWLLVTAYERPDTSPGGIIIPDAYRTDGSGWLWDVVAVGPGVMSDKGVRKPCDSLPGDIVHSDHPYAAQEIGEVDSENRKLYLLSESQVAFISWRP